jgi:hypothetical protein
LRDKGSKILSPFSSIFFKEDWSQIEEMEREREREKKQKEKLEER